VAGSVQGNAVREKCLMVMPSAMESRNLRLCAVAGPHSGVNDSGRHVYEEIWLSGESKFQL
jgi:hypothetical protein